MGLVRRHPLALTLILLVVAGAASPLPPLLDAVTGSPPGDVDLVRPWLYVVLAPLSNTLDALTFLSIERIPWALGGWAAVLVLWALARRGSRLARVARAAGLLTVLVALIAAAVALPRPVPRLVTEARSLTILDYHAHTEASHDKRSGWTPERVAWWHARQGFDATYVTDHNVVFPGATGAVELLPGAEWSVHRQHVLALGAGGPIDRERFQGSTARMLGIFAELHRLGALTVAALPEYWRNHWDALEEFVAAGVDGFELIDCAPKALGFPAAARRRVVALANQHDLLLIGASDHHGWGMVTCVWNLAAPGAAGFYGNRVIVRSIAMSQGEGPVWTAAATQPWRMARTLTWSERVSWLTWIVVILVYRAVPRRDGQGGGLAILARSLKLRALFRRPEDGAGTG